MEQKRNLKRVNKLVELESDLAPVYELSPEQKEAIETGLKDVEEGKVYSSENANRMIREWLEK